MQCDYYCTSRATPLKACVSQDVSTSEAVILAGRKVKLREPKSEAMRSRNWKMPKNRCCLVRFGDLEGKLLRACHCLLACAHCERHRASLSDFL